ncbi:MAG: biopolymer transporter ExbD [Planctomycetota bacterium]|nr:biopolymer transporter ExbD [Planctomycetota bacterium]
MKRKRQAHGAESETRAELAITPMIDVVFLLLVFFLLASRFKVAEGELKPYLPKDRGAGSHIPPIDLYEVRLKLLWHDDQNRPTTDRKAGHVVLKISNDIYPGKTIMDPVTGRLETFPDWEALYQDLLDFKQVYRGTSPKGLPVIIDARRSVPWKHVVSALDQCIRADLKNITFAAPAIPLE